MTQLFFCGPRLETPVPNKLKRRWNGNCRCCCFTWSYQYRHGAKNILSFMAFVSALYRHIFVLRIDVHGLLPRATKRAGFYRLLPAAFTFSFGLRRIISHRRVDWRVDTPADLRASAFVRMFAINGGGLQTSSRSRKLSEIQQTSGSRFKLARQRSTSTPSRPYQ